MKNIQIDVSGDECGMLVEAIGDRVSFLNDTAAGLLKKKLPEAAEPLYKAAQTLKDVSERVRERFNKVNSVF